MLIDSQRKRSKTATKKLCGRKLPKRDFRMLFGRERRSAKKLFGDSRSTGDGKRKVAKKLFG
jgi:hypothetical protein